MSWQDRLRPEIVLTSPDGDEFSASWAGGDVTVDKKLGQFDIPNIDGTITQDLGIRSSVYPLTFWFTGENHDQESARFLGAMRQRGPWVVVHPVLGELELQPAGVTAAVQPVENGNVTRISGDWIETPEEAQAVSIPELAGEIESVSDDLTEASEQGWARNVIDAGALAVGASQAFIAAVSDAIRIAARALRNIARTVADIEAGIDGTIRSVTAALEDGLDSAVAVAGGIRNLITLPALIQTDFFTRAAAYRDIINGLFESPDTRDRTESIVTTGVRELAATAAIQGLAKTAITSELQTRAQAVDAARQLADAFTEMTRALDDAQAVFSDAPATRKYFSQTDTYGTCALLTYLSVQYLLRRSRDLAIEKRFTLDRPRAPIEIAITEYGSLNESRTEADNFDLFIESNELSPEEIHVLPSGREVVVYV